MDAVTLREELESAERRVSLGSRLIAEQRVFLDDARRDGRDTADYEALLSELEDIQALHVADRARLQRELSRANGAGGG